MLKTSEVVPTTLLGLVSVPPCESQPVLVRRVMILVSLAVTQISPQLLLTIARNCIPGRGLMKDFRRITPLWLFKKFSSQSFLCSLSENSS